MNSNEIKIYYARNLQDALYHLRTVTDLSITAGCTGTMNTANPVFLTFPDSILSVRQIAEFTQITKTERFIEFGSAVTLAQIEGIDFKRQPTVLRDAISTIANPYVRAMGTIGGNICTQPMKMTTFAPLLALDAKLEFHGGTDKAHLRTDKKHSFSEIVSIPISQFSEVPPGYFLVKIRIPLEEWDIALFRRTGPKHEISELSASYVFLANTQKNILEDLRLAFCGVFSFRNRELENSLIGNKLPLSPKVMQSFHERTLAYFDSYTELKDIHYQPILRAQFSNLLANSLEKLGN